MSVFAPLDPVPQNDPLVERSGAITANWFRWLSQLVARSTISVLKSASSVHRTGLGASIVATTLFLPSQTGNFRVSWYSRVTTPATTSSSITVTIGWKDGGVACTKTFAAITGNTTASADGDGVFIRADSGQPVTYAVAYASVGGTSMVYMVDVAAEAMP